MAALEDSVLKKAVEKLSADHKDVEIRAVGVDLGREGYVEQVRPVDQQKRMANAQ